MENSPDNNRVKKAREAIKECQVLELLEGYSPVVVSTIFVGLDTEQSDIDIVCQYDCQNTFASTFLGAFGQSEHFELNLNDDYLVGRFHSLGFLVEVYASPMLVKSQAAFRHYQVMERLVRLGGPTIQRSIRTLKRRGLKTEPAICQVLGLNGDPYQAVLSLSSSTDGQLFELLQSHYNKTKKGEQECPYTH
ncbi:DUF4269 domain-containing protein [Pseudohongiella sp. O18]|uniref:DUF4269 domain-containing protein n=1 Tax=Pseudohongiella sp. O18 TaxID=2904248 RepID=UPI001F1ED804|nr:DUF4269 domain-containing protein [Pseudohongiella sp. O18]